MAEYRLTENADVIRTADGLRIPNDPLNLDRVAYAAWRAAGGVPDEFAAVVPSVELLSQDIMAQFTVADYGLIKVAISAHDEFGLLWASLQAQRDPMRITSVRFVTGWSALVTVLGRSRMNQIATVLGAHVLVA
jgi:hypothetical protein